MTWISASKRVLQTGFGRHLVQAPALGDALQAVLATILEDEPGACYKVFHHAGCKHLPGAGEPSNPRADVYRKTAHSIGNKAETPRCQACGKAVRCGECGAAIAWKRTDHARLEAILGTPTYRFFYRSPGARHRMMHGSYVDQGKLAEHTPILRRAVEVELWMAMDLPQAPAFGRERSSVRYSVYPMWVDSGDGGATLDQLIRLHDDDSLSFESSPRLLRQPEIDSLHRAY